MKMSIYKGIPEYAKEIRRTVFVDEQGFHDEFDETDRVAAHIIAFDEDANPVATCRIFKGSEPDTYILGRLAVLKEYRGNNIGSKLVKEAENYVRENGGKRIALHAQCRACAFYQKSGFTAFGETEEEEGCPHIWMEKRLGADQTPRP